MEDYINQYLTFIAQENCKFTFSPYSSNKIYYSLDSGTTWTQGSAVTVNAGTKVMWKGEMTPRWQEGVGTFSSTSLFSAEGNPMSLLFGDNFSGQTDLNLASGSGAFGGLFELCKNLASIDNLVLPATTLRNSCYNLMFHGCTSLTTVPSNLLPSTTLADGCYSQMFYGCTSLTTAPQLPATTLANYCYQSMFYNCTSLTTAPVLSAATLGVCSYLWMFYNCTNLNYIKCLATDISALNCVKDWTYNVASAGTFVKDASMASWTRGDSGIPNGWDTPAEPIYKWVKLDPTTDSICAVCYPPIYRETSGETYCSETNYDKLIDVTTEASYDNGIHWQFDHSATTVVEKDSEDCGYVPDPREKYLTFVAQENCTFTFTPTDSNVISYSTDGGVTWTKGNSVSATNGQSVLWKGEMTSTFYGVGTFSTVISTSNFTVKGNIMSLIYGDNARGQTSFGGGDRSYMFKDLFKHCSGLTSAEDLILPATTLTDSCYYGMFYMCTNLTTAPRVLPATRLLRRCYMQMFLGCYSLTTAPRVLPATTLTEECYAQMFQDCQALTTAPELPATTLAKTCYYQMFAGCYSLTTAPELPATTLTEECYAQMFQSCTRLNYIKCLATNMNEHFCTRLWHNGVAASGTFVKASSADWGSCGDSGIPCGWTIIDA